MAYTHVQRMVNFLFLILATRMSHACDLNASFRCLSSMHNSVGDLAALSASVEGDPISATDKLCRGIQELSSCVGGKLSNCSFEHKIFHEIAMSSGRFICKEGKQGFLDNFKCLTSQYFENSTLICAEELMKTIMSISSDDGSFSLAEWSATMCRLKSEVNRCVMNEVLIYEGCNLSSANYLKQYIDATIAPIGPFLSCESNTDPVPFTSTTPKSTSTPVTKGPTPVPRCNRYCSIKTEDAIVLPSSTRESYDDWCDLNCRQGYCPPNMCTCLCAKRTSTIVCQAVKGKFAKSEDGNTWCNNVCKKGFCPKTHCQCHDVL